MTNEQKLNNQVESNEEEVTVVENEPMNQNEESSQVDSKDEEVKVDLTSLFADEDTTSSNGNNQMNKTARLTEIASNIAREVLTAANDNPEEYSLKVKASQKSHDAMDDLIGELYSLGSVDTGFLKGQTDEEYERMIRSQQSKRSRAKSKTMTLDNYLTMMTGAVAENLLRLVANKPKSSGGGYSTSVGYTEEDLESFANYPEELKKAIRNVQSKKSIMKSKADFDPTSPRWMELLKTEEQLKAIRDNQNARASKEAQEALDRQAKLNEMLEGINAEDTDPAQAAEMLKAVQNMLAGK